MPSGRDLRNRLVTPENAGLAVAVGLSVVGAYAIRLRVGAGVAAFLGLIVLGVSTPTTLASHDLSGTRLASAVVRAGVACVLTFLTYVGLVTLVAGRAGSLVAAVAAFLLTALAAEAVARGLA